MLCSGISNFRPLAAAYVSRAHPLCVAGHAAHALTIVENQSTTIVSKQLRAMMLNRPANLRIRRCCGFLAG
jgi:hypothetical protein